MTKKQIFEKELNKLTKQELIFYILKKSDLHNYNVKNIEHTILELKTDINLQKQSEILDKLNNLPNDFSIQKHIEFMKLNENLDKLDKEFNKLMKEREALI